MVRLKFKEHGAFIQGILAGLCHSETSVDEDVEFAVRGGRVGAHAVVVHAASDFILDLVTGVENGVLITPHITSSEALTCLKELIYLGEVKNVCNEAKIQVVELCTLLGLKNVDTSKELGTQGTSQSAIGNSGTECTVTPPIPIEVPNAECGSSRGRAESQPRSENNTKPNGNAEPLSVSGSKTGSSDTSSRGRVAVKRLKSEQTSKDTEDHPDDFSDAVHVDLSDDLPQPDKGVQQHSKISLVPPEAGDRSPKEEPVSKLNVMLEENLTKTKRDMGVKRSVPPPSAQEPRRRQKGKRVFVANMKKSELTCKDCGKECTAPYKLKIHMLIHSESPPFSCSVCCKGFHNKYKMRAHEKKCYVKGQEKMTLKSLKENKMRQRKEKPTKPLHICQHCDASHASKASLKKHVSVEHPDLLQYKCSRCSKVFKGKRGLNHHVAYVCNRSEKKFSCNVCHVKVVTARDLKLHMAVHETPRQQWKCDKCPTVCKSRKSLKIHCRVAHLDDGFDALPYQCLHCGKLFLKQSYLEEHLNRFHVVVKQFGCMFCTKRCATKQDLNRHLASHQGKPVFHCTQCPKSFVHRANFTDHMRSHSGTRPYKCLPCNKTFGLLCVLRKHQKSHERKGDATQIVTAPKGRRGCLSYIDFLTNSELESEPPGRVLQSLAPVQPVEEGLYSIATGKGTFQDYIPSEQQYNQGTTNVANPDYRDTPSYTMMQVCDSNGYGSSFTSGENIMYQEPGTAQTYTDLNDDTRVYQTLDNLNTPIVVEPAASESSRHDVMTARKETGSAMLVISNTDMSLTQEHLTETEAIVMDRMGFFNEAAPQETQTQIQHI